MAGLGPPARNQKYLQIKLSMSIFNLRPYGGGMQPHEFFSEMAMIASGFSNLNVKIGRYCNVKYCNSAKGNIINVQLRIHFLFSTHYEYFPYK